MRYFGIRINAEGYLNYHYIALQNEDAFDVLPIKYPHCIFVFLMDQILGYGKMRPGAL